MFYERFKAFLFAFNGLKLAIQHEFHVKIHFFAAIAAIVMGWKYGISTFEWLIVLLLIGGIISLEIVNSAIEKACDLIEPNHNEIIGKIKDLAAGAVLWSSLIAAVIGGIIFIPKIIG